MRYLILLASLTLGASALAEENPKSVAKELDKSSPQLMSADAPADSSEATDAKEKHNKTKGRAQDYISSRSNTTAVREDTQGDLDRYGRVDVVTCLDGVDQDCDDDGVDASPANHNTTRSNRLAPANDGDDQVMRKKPGKR